MKNTPEKNSVALDVEEMKKEWHEFKTRALGILLAGLIAMVGYGAWIGNISSEISYNSREIDSQDKKQVILEQRLGSLEVTNSEVRARLQSIEATLQEIKISIKGLN